jgi:hypothetical protein
MSTIPSEVLTWQLSGKTGNVRAQNTYSTNTGYSLFCTTNKRYLTYGKEPLGINLVYSTTDADKKIHFRLPDGKERDVLTGEAVAFGIGGGDAFLFYDNRTLGINLSWSGSAKHEWSIWGADGKQGVPIVQGQPYALINKNVQPSADFLVYLDRAPGMADVGWTSSPNWPGKVFQAAKEYGPKAAALVAML